MRLTQKSPKRGAAGAGPLRFVTTGKIIPSDEDAEIVGRALIAIAEENQVDNIRSLDAVTVLEAVLADASHPLRPYYEWDTKAAARKHWLEHTRELIRGVRFVSVQMPPGPVQKPRPLFCTADAPTKIGARIETRRVQVMREDVLRDDPTFVSAIGLNIRRIRDALMQLEQLTSERAPAGAVTRLRDEIREAFNRYASSLDVAAE